MLKLTYNGCRRDLDCVKFIGSGSFLALNLFVNDHTPAPDDDGSEYVIASWAGYVADRFVSWGTPTVTADGAEMVGSPVSWTNTATTSQKVYGYVLTDSTGQWWGAERDPLAPVDMSIAGTIYTVTPRLECKPQ